MKNAKRYIIAGLMSLTFIMTSCSLSPSKSNKELNEYTIKFVDYDNYLLSSIKVKEGTVPVYEGEEPYRDPTKQYSYTFTGWTPEVVAATENKTYQATYQEEVRKYTVRFLNEDGTELQKESLPYGSLPTYKGVTPTKDRTAQYSYTFNDWDKQIEQVTKNATYTATYNSTVNNYIVTFNTNGGSQVASQTIAYGGHVEQPEDPTKESTGDEISLFLGWDFDFENEVITEDTTINASWYEVDSSMPHGNDCVYFHYPKYLPETGVYGYEEFWYCPVHHLHSMTEPEAEYIFESQSSFSEPIPSNDERYISLIYDENHMSLKDYHYGAGMYSVDLEEFKNFRITYLDNGFKCNLYSENNEFYTWRIDLPRIDFTKYRMVSMDVNAPDWYQPNKIGPELDDLSYQTVYGGNKDKGKITFSYKTTGLLMEFNSIEYANQLAFSKIITDDDIIHGLKSPYFYLTDKWDRYINFTNIKISTERPLESIDFTFGGDTSKISVVNGDVALPGSVDYSVINNKYGTNDTSLIISGNAKSDAAVITLPAFNFNEYTETAEIVFVFGVKNNKEHMYFGSGSSRVDLGQNSPTSESSNNNGYVNWQLVVRNDEAYVYNKYENHNYPVALTPEMRNGSERISISGGDTSKYRVYLITDFRKRAY